jgi:hypothetical protein
MTRPLPCLVALALLGGCKAPPAPREPLGAPARLLGAPFHEASLYARNIWDLQAYAGRIYVGHGDAVDNWGPITVWSIDPASGTLRADYTTAEEQVDALRVLADGALYLPGFDSRGRSASGSFYKLEKGVWRRRGTVPHGVHVFDLALHEGRLFAAIGAAGRPGQPTLLVSGDGGATWSAAAAEWRRMHTLFELGGVLYAAPELFSRPQQHADELLALRDGHFVGTGIRGSTLLAGVPELSGRMLRPTPFHGTTLYIATGGTFNWQPAALLQLTPSLEVRPVTLPVRDARPYDLLVRGNRVYLLTGERTGSGRYQVRIHASGDLRQWREVVHFASPTFARSFDEVNGDFFLGLGCTFEEASPACGELLRISSADTKLPPN